MPYIIEKERDDLDPALFSLPESLTPGDLAYIVYWLLCTLTENPSFAILSSYYGAAELALLEFKRRKIDPYEDAKRQENGDV